MRYRTEANTGSARGQISDEYNNYLYSQEILIIKLFIICSGISQR